MKHLLTLLLITGQALLVVAQTDHGIVFVQDRSWAQVLQQAKTENKYILVDCFATWCVPCKKMDAETFVDSALARQTSKRFIAVRVQMDRRNNDPKAVRDWYAQAHSFEQEYRIREIPTFLFFTPGGVMVYRDAGFKDIAGFRRLLADAQNPAKQYPILLDRYRLHRLPYRQVPDLFVLLMRSHKDQLADSVAHDYIENYLMKKKPDSLYTKANLDAIITGVRSIHTMDKAFGLFFLHGGKVDSINGRPGISRQVTDYLISREMILPEEATAENQASVPDWDGMQVRIKARFGSLYADRIIADAQVDWYKKKKDWPLAIRYFVRKTEIQGVDTTSLMGEFYTNNMIWSVILFHCDDPVILNKALAWEKLIIHAWPTDWPAIDTYACLLYKLGRKQEALSWEKKAVDGSPRDTGLAATYEKMRNGSLTWDTTDVK